MLSALLVSLPPHACAPSAGPLSRERLDQRGTHGFGVRRPEPAMFTTRVECGAHARGHRTARLSLRKQRLGLGHRTPPRFARQDANSLFWPGTGAPVRDELGKTVRIERSRDLVTWEPVATLPVSAAGQALVDLAATTEPFRFYRAVVAL